MESDGMIPLGSFIEFTWHSVRPEPEDVQEKLGPGDSVQWIGIIGDEPTPPLAATSAPTILSDAIWKPRQTTDD